MRKNRMPVSQFASPRQHKEPIQDAEHVRNAIGRFEQLEDISDADRDAAWKRITAARPEVPQRGRAARLAGPVEGRQGTKALLSRGGHVDKRATPAGGRKAGRTPGRPRNPPDGAARRAVAPHHY